MAQKCQFCSGTGENRSRLSETSSPYEPAIPSLPRACPECGGTGKNMYPDGPELDTHHRHLESRVLANKKKRSKR